MLQNDFKLKKTIVYYGAPGTGKTYKAKEKAMHFIDHHRIKSGGIIGRNYSVKLVQFHPSYAYEDFLEGIRPTEEGKLVLQHGVFKAFCKKNGEKERLLLQDANFLEKFKVGKWNFDRIKVKELNDKQCKILGIKKAETPEALTLSEVIEPSFFIIDEINRAELSRVFGELMYSLEYRGYEGKIKTQYSYLVKEGDAANAYFWEDDEDWFFIPHNIYIMGTMNTIDRSVDSFDFALRRRFSWEEVEPNYKLITALLDANWKERLAESFKQLNKAIEKEPLLGKDYRIGHAYALNIRGAESNFEKIREARDFIWNNFIKALLEEYLRSLGDDRKAQEKLKTFKEAFGLKE